MDVWAKYDDSKQIISADTLSRIRTTLRHYTTLVLAEEDYSGGLKGDLSRALSRFGDVEDTSIIRNCIKADIGRLHSGLEAREKEAHNSPQAQGMTTRWDHWHLSALVRLDPKKADSFLLELLKNPFYEEGAVRGLVSLLNHDEKERAVSTNPLQFKAHLASHSPEQKNNEYEKMRQRFASAVMTHIKTLRLERDKAKNRNLLTWRLKKLATLLASFHEPEAAGLIMEIMALSQEWDAWTRVETLEKLIKDGIQIDMDATEKVLKPAIEEILKESIHTHQNLPLLRRCISLFIFTNDPARGVERIREFLSEHSLSYEMRDLITTLGQSGSRDAAMYLIELAQDPDVSSQFGHELLKALASLRYPEVKEALLSVVDPTSTLPKIRMNWDFSLMETLTQVLGDFCREDDELRNKIYRLCSDDLPDSLREVVAGIIEKLSTTDAVLHGLNLILDKTRNPIPAHLREAIDKLLVKRVPVTGHSDLYNLTPQEGQAIRERLFDILMHDPGRRKSAYELLGFIEQLRLKFGKPPTEPRHPNLQAGKPWPPLDFMGHIK